MLEYLGGRATKEETWRSKEMLLGDKKYSNYRGHHPLSDKMPRRKPCDTWVLLPNYTFSLGSQRGNTKAEGAYLFSIWSRRGPLNRISVRLLFDRRGALLF